MDFLGFLVIIFVPVIFCVIISNINDKVDKDEELNSFEKFIFNLATGIVKIIISFIKFSIETLLPFLMCFIPLIMFLVLMFANLKTELIQFILIIAFVVSVMVVGVLKLIFTKKEKDE